jgi:hypothetical protein
MMHIDCLGFGMTRAVATVRIVWSEGEYEALDVRRSHIGRWRHSLTTQLSAVMWGNDDLELRRICPPKMRQNVVVRGVPGQQPTTIVLPRILDTERKTRIIPIDTIAMNQR